MAAAVKFAARQATLPKIVVSKKMVKHYLKFTAANILIVITDAKKDVLVVGSGQNAGADEDDFHVVARGRKEDEPVSKSKGKIKRLVGGKIIIRVDDEPSKAVTPKPTPPVAKVKTVVF